ncbi:MAG TPA: RHS repeat-associated core domain-containing protein, partial [Pirellula sp.]|nr:RHS repeat-associated core domain-containing protein [Pirellula sp.]
CSFRIDRLPDSRDTMITYTPTWRGWRVSTKNPAGETTHVDYDQLGRVVASSGDTSAVQYAYWPDGSIKNIKDELKRSTNYDYDRRGRLTSVQSPVPTSGVAASITSFQYLVDGLLQKVTDPLARITEYSYDVGGRLFKSTMPDPDGTGALMSTYSKLTRDSLGNLMAVTDAIREPLNKSTRFVRDAWFRPTAVIDANNDATSTAYDVFGNITSVTDPLNNVTSYIYNNVNQRITDSLQSNNRTFKYDGIGNMRSMIDRNGRTTNWSYDVAYRQTSESWMSSTSPIRGISYTYDAADRLTSISDTAVQAASFRFSYDSRGQLQNESQFHTLMGRSFIVDRDYDAVGNRIGLSLNIGGRMTGSNITGGVSDFKNTYGFDGMNRLASLTQTSLSGSNAVAPKLVTQSYNAASELTDLRRYAATAASTSTLKVHTRMTYDGAGRNTSITHAKTEISAGQSWNGTSTLPTSLTPPQTLAAYSLTYDSGSRLTDLATYKDAFQTTFAYDNRDQLQTAMSTAIAGLTLPVTPPTTETYSVDSNGNRKSTAGTSQSASVTFNRLQSDGTYNYQYDNEGNTTKRTLISTGAVTEYAWDHRNRLTTVTERVSAAGATTKKTEYVYDAFDQRIGKRFDADGNGTWDRVEAFIWADGQEQLRLVDSDGQGTARPFRIANRYMWGESVDQLYADEQYTANNGYALNAAGPSTVQGNTLWTLADQLGSIRDIVDNTGVVRQHVVFDSFGRRVREVDYSASGTQIANTDINAIDELFGYTGRDWDADTNLQNNRARWYDPVNGRFLSQDSIGFAGGDANLYRYVGNGSTNATDPSGRVLIAIDGTGTKEWLTHKKN